MRNSRRGRGRIAQLDEGKLRVAEKIDGQWVTHQWLKEGRAAVVPQGNNSFVKGGFHPTITTKYRPNLPTTTAAIPRRRLPRGAAAAARKGASIAKNVC